MNILDKDKQLEKKDTKDPMDKTEELLKKKGQHRSTAGDSRKSGSKGYGKNGEDSEEREKSIQPAGSNFE